MRRRLYFLLPLAAACMRAPEPPHVSAPPAAPPMTPPPSSAPVAPDDATHAGVAPAPAPSRVRLAVPEGWTRSGREVMFAFEVWELPGGGACTLSQVGGDVDQNIQRWAGQFTDLQGDMQVETLAEAAYATKLAVAKGTFAATQMVGGGPPREDWMLVGAAVSGTSLGGTIYLKAVGPRAQMEQDLPALRSALAALEIGG